MTIRASDWDSDNTHWDKPSLWDSGTSEWDDCDTSWDFAIAHPTEWDLEQRNIVNLEDTPLSAGFFLLLNQVSNGGIAPRPNRNKMHRTIVHEPVKDEDWVEKEIKRAIPKKKKVKAYTPVADNVIEEIDQEIRVEFARIERERKEYKRQKRNKAIELILLNL